MRVQDLKDTAAPPSSSWEPRLVEHRVALTGYCYRMLGSAFDAEDAVQETLLRAWRNLDRFDEGRGSMRSWLFAIATNICFDMLRGRGRRARAVDLGPSSTIDAPLGAPLPEERWVQPVPDSRVLPADGDPAELAVARETIRLAFVAALQHLPPRQRAVLLLREVLCWKADEVAQLLGTSVASVNSALQRARATLGSRDLHASRPPAPMDQDRQELAARYADAFERDDVDALVALLHEDARMTMPPFAWWLRGRGAIRTALLDPDAPCHGSRMVPVAANGSPSFGQYAPTGPGGTFEPWALVMLEISGGQIMEMTSFLDAHRLFPLFGLPLQLEGQPSER